MYRTLYTVHMKRPHRASSHTDNFSQRSFYTRELERRRCQPFTHRTFCTHTHALKRRSFYREAEQLLRRAAFAHQTPLHWTHTRLYIEALRTEAFTQKLYREKLVQRSLFIRASFCTEAFTHKSFHTHAFTHRVFTHRVFTHKELVLCLGTCSWDSWLGICSWEPTWNFLLGTCSWKLCLLASNLIGTLLGNLFSCLGTLFRNLSFGTWDSVLASNLACSCSSIFYVILLSKLFLESCFWEHEQPVLANLAWEPVCWTFLATFALENFQIQIVLRESQKLWHREAFTQTLSHRKNWFHSFYTLQKIAI